MNRTDHEKRKQIIPWIDPAERMTMHFLDEKDLNVEVTGTSEELVDRPGTGINPLRGQNNVQGASDVGCLPTYFAGYQSLDDPAVAARHQQITGRPLPAKRGMKTPDMGEAALEGRLKGLWIIGYDVAQTDPNLTKVHEALRRLEFLVVQDLFMSETAKMSHLVLPVRGLFGERRDIHEFGAPDPTDSQSRRSAAGRSAGLASRV